MTRLKELRLHGFKTFADPTRFVFERGVTAVIGPNGSGKSNMADAVRWVLGEQSNRSLRTRRADDVIFAGSEGRRPQGMAEAVLTLDNTDRWLPIEFAEVSIGRRAYRSGETEYLINGARTRLKDVVDLLAGGRLGANELVVVGQGTVDAALSLRPEERRQLFEEAAGVKNLQVRKNEALGRLARARDNLTRVSDLVSELKPQVRRLALQAQHQQEHDELGRWARALVVEAHRRREVSARASLGDARRRTAAAEAALEALRAEEAAGRDAIVAAEGRYWAAEAAARAAAERREASREASIRAETGAAAVARRHADLLARINRAEAELSTLAATLEAEPDASDPDTERKWHAAREAERSWREAVAELEAADREIDVADQALTAARGHAGAWIAELARNDEAAARAGARVEHLESERNAAGTALGEATEAATSAQAELAAAEEAEAGARARLTEARGAADDAEGRADADRSRATVLAERVGGLRAEMEALRERAEGSGRLASTLAGAGWRALVDAIAPPEAAWAAIEAVVGGELQQALLWKDDDLIGHASAARGAARLLADPPVVDHPREAASRAEALAAVGATRTLAEWLGSTHAPRLFARTAVAADLATLLKGWRSLPAGWCAVTAEGDLADARGLIVIRGRQEGRAGEAARQHARQRELVGMVEQLDAEQGDAGRAAAQALVAATAARRDRDEATRRYGEAERRAGLARSAHGRAAEALARAGDLERSLDAQLNDARTLLNAAGPTPADPAVRAELDRLGAAAMEAHQRHAALGAERDRRRAAWQAAQSAADATDSGPGGRRYERAVQAARRDQLAAARTIDREALAGVEAEAAGAAESIASATADDEQAARDRVAAEAERDRLRADLLERERARGGAASELAALERGVQAAAIAAQRLDDELVAIGRERDLAIESLPPATADAEPAAAIDPLLAELATANPETIDAELARVRRTLAQIGSVNPFAVEEHRELADRLAALTGQDMDLGAAIASTEQLIARLEAEIAGQFNAAFVAIGAKFDEFCRLLFAGGSASLQMSEAGDEEGSGGIEIAVQPPGKRLQRLAMLSGGERALTGVALLFAMLSVNPVPFCILDEVDAALDEANIGRFADALRQLAREIDFVVITHNRATIETADTIYGVTMTDAAVSRLLSLRLADLPAEVVAG
jgi:chromosome segregation protein